MHALLQRFESAKVQVQLCFLACVIGIITGGIDALFGIVLGNLTAFRESYGWYFLLLIPFGALFVSFIYWKFGGKCKKGMGLVFEVEEGKEKKIPLLLIPFAIIGTWITHFVGGSAGREGVAMQIGATVSNWFSDKIQLKKGSRYLLPIGMAAGFAGLFQTPITSVVFALEVLVAGEMRYPVLLPSIVASYVAAAVSSKIGLGSSVIAAHPVFTENIALYIRLVILGLLFGLVGYLFSFAMHVAQNKCAELFPNPMKKAIVIGSLVAILLIIFDSGRYSGAGGNLIKLAIQGKGVYSYDWLLKFLFTILTMCSGLMGGEVVPLFTIGATLGAFIGPVLGVNATFAAMMGYAAVFSSGTNTFLAAVFVGSEIFGFAYMPYFFVVCAVAYVCNRNHSIYGLQKTVFPRKKEESK